MHHQPVYVSFLDDSLVHYLPGKVFRHYFVVVVVFLELQKRHSLSLTKFLDVIILSLTTFQSLAKFLNVNFFSNDVKSLLLFVIYRIYCISH